MASPTNGIREIRYRIPRVDSHVPAGTKRTAIGILMTETEIGTATWQTEPESIITIGQLEDT